LERVRVETKIGTIIGKKKVDDNGFNYLSFTGIPYAKPPVGKLRFRPPQTIQNYSEFEAFNQGSHCSQSEGLKDEAISGSEDCLFLYIHTKDIAKKKLKPVMLYLHGGAFIFGSGGIYVPTPLIKEDVVVVSVNYRLGALGFMTFGNDVAPGNLGIRDQIEALKWVKRHIIHFGGDPTMITVFGQSAGGVSSNALIMSPKTRGMINNAIMMSGTMLMIRNTYQVSRHDRFASVLAKSFNCPHEKLDSKMLECLQKIESADNITRLTRTTFTKFDETEFPRGVWAPVDDSFASDPVLPLEGVKAMKYGYFSKIPIMTGTVLYDGGVIIFKKDFEETFEKFGASALPFRDPFAFHTTGIHGDSQEGTNSDQLIDAKVALRFYNGGSYKMLEHVNDTLNLITDTYFLSPDQKIAEYASQYVPVYNYFYTYKPMSSLLPLYIINSGENYGEEAFKAFSTVKPVHGDEQGTLFDLPLKTNEQDKDMSQKMVKYFTNFVKYGNPTPPGLSENLTKWETYATEKNYLVIDKVCEMKKYIAPERMRFMQRMMWDRKEGIAERDMEMRSYRKHIQAYAKTNPNQNRLA